MSVRTGQTITREFPLSTTAGAASDADSTPTGVLLINGVASGATVTIAHPGTARYTFTVVLPVLLVGDQVQARITATVGGVTASSEVWTDFCEVSEFGGNVTYVNASDGAAGLLAATNTATPGAIMVGPGTFNLGANPLSRPPGLSLICAGPELTTITGTVDESTQGAIVPLNSNAITRGFTCYGYGASNASNFCAPTGWVNPFQPIPTNWLLEDVITDGDLGADGLLGQTKTTGTPATVRGRVVNCTFRAQFDSLNIFDNSNRGADVLIEYEDCSFISICPANSWDQTRAGVVSVGTHIFRRCLFVAQSISSTQSFTYAVNVRNGVVTNRVTAYFDDCRLILNPSTAGASADFLVGTTASSGTAGMSVFAANTHYLTTLGGPVTVVPLNAARATDLAGNALATAQAVSDVKTDSGNIIAMTSGSGTARAYTAPALANGPAGSGGTTRNITVTNRDINTEQS